MAIICRLQAACFLLLVMFCVAISRCQGETRCELLCNFESLREQCERCKLRVPMRFGKRSSPPEVPDMLLDLAEVNSPDLTSLLKASDDRSSQFIQYLTLALQNYLNQNDRQAEVKQKSNPFLSWASSRRKRALQKHKTTRHLVVNSITSSEKGSSH